jgi:YbgC/YbaW family acyl-CoA thioester hydrolase
MIMYWNEVTVKWGESDPFGLVYFPRMLSWFNDTEHELFRTIGFPIEQQIQKDRTTFVMGEIHFRFIGPAAYGDRIRCIISLKELRERTVVWHFKAQKADTGDPITEGKATRVFARIQEDGNLKSAPIPENIREALTRQDVLHHLVDDDLEN